MSQKLIVLMIDGVSADHYTVDRNRFPHLMALEARGLRVERLRSEVLGTSLPGRVSMLTGVTADVSGVYGNKIWDPAIQDFRYANPEDVRVPTLPARARAAGKRAAAIGFGMIRPQDVDIMQPPWWVGEFIQRARDAEPTPADEAWLRVAMTDPGEAFRATLSAAGVASHLPRIDLGKPGAAEFYGILSDNIIADWVGVLATSIDAPDLIIAEFLMTDTVQHYSGYRSDMSQWAVSLADMAVGRIVERLRAVGLLDQWNIAVMSDHGHSPVDQAIFTDVLLPGVRVQSEGGMLVVAPRDAQELAHVEEALAQFNVIPYPNDCIPPELRDQIYLFAAPERITFELDEKKTGQVIGQPNMTSSHGQKPGFPGDDRFALFAGPAVPRAQIMSAQAAQVAPTFAALLGLPLDDFPAAPIFEPYSS